MLKGHKGKASKTFLMPALGSLPSPSRPCAPCAIQHHVPVSLRSPTESPQLLLVHFLMLLPFFSACRLSLQWKFSSQNSANQMFRRLLSSVLLEK